jgi:flagellin-like hook-associated protein FlgL
VIIGATYADPNGASSGYSHLIFGKSITSFGTLNVASQTSLFSGTSASSGILTINGLTGGSTALANVTVSLESSANILANNSIHTASNAATALSTIDTSISNINSQRSLLGAFQNRLGHIVANLTPSIYQY